LLCAAVVRGEGIATPRRSRVCGETPASDGIRASELRSMILTRGIAVGVERKSSPVHEDSLAAGVWEMSEEYR
jgi:hypothetical protein